VWYENDGDQNFNTHIIATDVDGAYDVQASDLDGDGDVDILSASSRDDKVLWYKNDGNQNFEVHVISTNANGANSVQTADVNGDGYLDIITSSSADDKITWYELKSNFFDILSTTPTNATNHYNATGAITLEFEEAIDANSIDGNIIIHGAQTGLIPGTYSGQGTPTITFIPDEAYKPGEQIVVTITTGLQSTFGASLSKPHTFEFRVEAGSNPEPYDVTTHIISTDVTEPREIYVSDIDGDGDMDVLSASSDDDKIAWHENNGNQNFDTHIITTESNSAWAVHATDVDGDGDMDVLSASYSDDKIAWYENDGNQNFTAHVISTDAEVALDVHTADLDGDGDMDVLGASSWDDKIAWYENDGSQNFITHVISTDANGANEIYASDIDGDGDMDLLSTSYFDDKIVWYENDGDQNFDAHVITIEADGVESVYIIDIDNDSDMDVLSASGDDGMIAWYENDGDQNFIAHVITTNAIFAREVYASDVDGDGDTDVLSASSSDDKVAWYENDGNQNFTTNIITTEADGAQSVRTADIDGDGDMDVISSSFVDDKIAWYELKPATFKLVSTTPTHATNHYNISGTITLEFDEAIEGTSIADNIIIHGAQTGLVPGTYSGQGTTTITFTPEEPYKPGEQIVVTITAGLRSTFGSILSQPHTFEFWAETGNNSEPYDVTTHIITTDADGALDVHVSDIDSDGDMDVLSASSIDDKIAWYENDGNQSFTTHIITSDADGARSVYATDIDGDGDMDVLSASNNDDKIAWYENNGNQSFTTHIITTDADGALDVHVSDIDSDGDMDVLSASPNDDKVIWHENDGNQNFVTHIITMEADGVWSVQATDIDSDGDLDILSASRDDNEIAWYKNDGNLNFTSNIITNVAYGVRDVRAIDLDDDNDIDILSASYNDNKIAWYENDGNQNFNTHIITLDAFDATSLYITDINGDGHMDVLSSSREDDKIAWYKNDGNQNFIVQNITSNANWASSVFAADMDDDGNIDVLSASYVDDKIAWYELNPFLPLSANVELIADVSCFGYQDGSAEINTSGGVEPYTYHWDNGEATAIAVSLSPGLHEVTVTDANSNTITGSVFISEPPVLEASLENITPVNCNQAFGTASVEVSGGTPAYEFLWSNGVDSDYADNLMAGSHQVTVTDANGCTETLGFIIDEIPPPEVSIDAIDHVSCYGLSDGRISLTVSEGISPYEFEWSNGANSNPLDSLSTGTFDVTISDAIGCLVSASIEISSPSQLVSNITSTNETAYNSMDGSVSVSPTGGTLPHNILWSTGADTPQISGLSPGTYTVTITDANGCQISEETTVEAFNCFMEADLTYQQISCFGDNNGQASLSVSNGTIPTHIQWSNGEEGQMIDGLSPGVYGVTVTDENNCMLLYTFEIIEPQELALNELSINDISCFGEADGSILIEGTGGTPPYNFDWENGSEGPALENIGPGSYGVVLTDSMGCIDIQSFIVAEPDPLLITLQGIIPESNGQSNGGALVSVSGGTMPYSYDWRDESGTTISTAEVLDSVTTGTYTLQLEDQNGCTSMISFFIDQVTNTVDYELANNLRLSPNPTAAILNIELTLDKPQGVQYKFFDTTGRLIQEGERPRLQNHIWEANLSEFPSGVYFFSIFTNVESVVRRVVVY